MLPLKLTIKGIYSYINEQIIDFEKLTQNNLFGIFGKTGSGKSTILEAITFAIFGKTERLNRNDAIIYNLMNLKSQEMYLDLEILASDGNKYRFYRRYKRNPNHFDNTILKENTRYIYKEGQWLPEKRSSEDIIGMGYDNFRRTVIIPQGRFQDFLMLNVKDRSNMLKEIFALEKYDLFEITSKLFSKTNAELQEIIGHLNEIGILDKKTILNKKKELKTIKKKSKDIENKLKEKRRNLSILEAQRDIFEEYERKKVRAYELNLDKPKFEERKKELAEYRIAITRFKPVLDALYEIQNDIKKKKEEIVHKKETLEFINKHYIKIKNEFNDTESLFYSIPKFEKEIIELNDLLKIKDLTEKAKHISNEIRDLEADIRNYVSLIEEKNKEIKNFETIKEEKQKGIQDIQTLYTILTWFVNYNGLIASLDEIKTHIKEKNINLLSIERNLKNFFPDKFCIELDNGIEGIKKGFIKLKEKKQELIKEKNKLEIEYAKLGVSMKLAEYAINLKEGEKCPVCGSVEHPDILKLDKTSNSFSVCSENLEKLKKDIEIINIAEKHIIPDLAVYEENQREIEKLNKKEVEKQKAIKEYRSKFVWSKYSIDKPEEVSKDLENAQNLQRECEVLSNKIKNISTIIVKKKEVLEKKKNILNNRQNTLAGIRASIDTIAHRFRKLDIQKLQELSNNQIKDKIKYLEETISTINDKFNRLKDEYAKLQKKKTSLETSINDLCKQLEELNHKINKKEEIFNKELNDSEFKSRDALENIIQSKIDVEQESKKINDFEKELHFIDNRLLELEKKKDPDFDLDKFQQMLDSIKFQEVKLKEIHDKIGFLKKEIKDLTSSMEAKINYEKKQKELEKRKANIQVLKNLFSGNKFVQYVSIVYLHNLVKIANKRFYKLTNQRYLLELKDNGDFIIRDFLNSGNTRSVKTLSGGQIFQISFCLALALAEEIQIRKRSTQNFFFLDEGFGTQDKDSLRMVFNTLESLKKENRIVGLISHVEELQEEINTYIKVSLDNVRGSFVKASWEL